MMVSASFGVYEPCFLLIPMMLVLMVRSDLIIFCCMDGYCLKCSSMAVFHCRSLV